MAAIVFRCLFVVVLATSAATVPAHSQRTPTQVAPPDPQPSAPDVLPTSTVRAAPTEEVAVLRAQLETMEKYQERLLDTVYWSLGALGAVFLALIGFSWFTNFRVYDRDRAALAQDLRGVVHEEVAGTQRELSTKLDQWKKEAQESVRAAAAAIGDKSRQEIQGLHYQLVRLEIDLAQLQAEVWTAKKSHGNAFSALIRAAELGQLHGQDWVVSRVIDRIEKTIQDMDGIFGSDLTKIARFLDGLSDPNAVDAQRLREVLKSVRTL